MTVTVGIEARQLGVQKVAGYAVFALAGAGLAAVIVYASATGGGGATPVKLALAELARGGSGSSRSSPRPFAPVVIAARP